MTNSEVLHKLHFGCDLSRVTYFAQNPFDTRTINLLAGRTSHRNSVANW
jgi:hypothetical protein